LPPCLLPSDCASLARMSAKDAIVSCLSKFVYYVAYLKI